MAGSAIPQLQCACGNGCAAAIAVLCRQHQSTVAGLGQGAVCGTQIADLSCKRQGLVVGNRHGAAAA
ncbi:hypothetical protein Brsp05_04706 [Brucella sp. NBRC 12953]